MDKFSSVVKAIGTVTSDIEPIDEESEILEFLPEDEE